MLCYLDGSDGALDGVLRAGNAGADQAKSVELRLEQLPREGIEEGIVLHGDSAARAHDLVDFCRSADIEGTRLICLRERACPGAQLALIDTDS